MADRLKRYKPHLCVLSKAGPEARKAILRDCQLGLIKCVCECVLNVLQGNIKVDHSAKKTLKRHKSLLRKLASHKISLHKKRQALVQSGGGFFLTLLPAVISAIAALAAR